MNESKKIIPTADTITMSRPKTGLAMVPGEFPLDSGLATSRVKVQSKLCITICKKTS
eukprot:CAMPEP_0182515052 /NCGR_PEP_ID=MMETSP1321-20130603/37274_1 /TAXON_ID=91990 /ORGANISM="Bolidomonas sp., Strain RCC1657" /LENGTH=56 /DNA_ID=CAMNT_0024722401 /DNA_START=106 /DNA_END=276 /DNA_ORIENTATION=-